MNLIEIRDLSLDFHSVKFINLSHSALGIFGKSCEPFTDMCNELEFDKQHTDFIVRMLSTIIIRSTCYIFCMRNKPWTNPDLLIYYLREENFYTKIYIPYTVFLSCSEKNFFHNKSVKCKLPDYSEICIYILKYYIIIRS